MYPKPDKLIPAVYGGIILGLISSIPFLNLLNCLCCAGVIGGGVFAVTFYKNNFTPETPPFTANDCMVVGGLAGMIGAVITTILWAIFNAAFGNVVGEYLLKFLENANIQGVPPELVDQLRAAMKEGLSVLAIFLELLKNLIVDILFGGLGGLIAYGMYRPKTPIMPPPMSRPPGM